MFKNICSLIKNCKVKINKIGLDPWAWFRDGVHHFNSNRRGVLHQGVYQTLDESMYVHEFRKGELGRLPNISFIHNNPKPLGSGNVKSGHSKFLRKLLLSKAKERAACKLHTHTQGGKS
jgi:hypothetical protein